MFKTSSKFENSAGILAVLACLVVLAAPTPASAADANWRIYGSLMDSDDLAEAFGGGLRVSFPFKDNYEFDISASYYEDFKNRFEDNTSERLGIELSFIPIDLGVTWTKDGDSGFQFGGGLSYAYLDINDLTIDGVRAGVTGSANDEFGGYLKIGYQAKGGFFGELAYRLLDASVKNVTIGGVPSANRDIALTGAVVNVGYRF